MTILNRGLAQTRAIVSEYVDAIQPQESYKTKLMGEVALLAVAILQKAGSDFRLTPDEQARWKRAIKQVAFGVDDRQDTQNYRTCKAILGVIRNEWDADEFIEKAYPFTQPTEDAIATGAGESIELWERQGGRSFYGHPASTDFIDLSAGEGGFWTAYKRKLAHGKAAKTQVRMLKRFQDIEEAATAVHRVALDFPAARPLEPQVDEFRASATEQLAKLDPIIFEIVLCTKPKHLKAPMAALEKAVEKMEELYNQARACEQRAMEVRRTGLAEPKPPPVGDPGSQDDFEPDDGQGDFEQKGEPSDEDDGEQHGEPVFGREFDMAAFRSRVTPASYRMAADFLLVLGLDPSEEHVLKLHAYALTNLG